MCRCIHVINFVNERGIRESVSISRQKFQLCDEVTFALLHMLGGSGTKWRTRNHNYIHMYDVQGKLLVLCLASSQNHIHVHMYKTMWLYAPHDALKVMHYTCVFVCILYVPYPGRQF